MKNNKMKLTYLAAIGGILLGFSSCEKEKGISATNPSKKSSEEPTEIILDYNIPRDHDSALSAVNTFALALEEYASGELDESNSPMVNFEYGFWVLEAAISKNFAHSAEEDYEVVREENDSLTAVVNIREIGDQEGYVSVYELANTYNEWVSYLTDLGDEVSPVVNLELGEVESIDGFDRSLNIKFKWYKHLWPTSGPVPLSPGDDYKAHTKGKCSSASTLNAADRLTLANRKSVPYHYKWFYSVDDYFIQNNSQPSYTNRDIYDYRMFHVVPHPFLGTIWQHPSYAVSSTYFDDHFLGGEYMSGISSGDKFAPAYCVYYNAIVQGDPDMVMLDDDIKDVIDQVDDEVDLVVGVKIWSGAERDKYSSTVYYAHHNMKFTGGESIVDDLGPWDGDLNPLDLGNVWHP